MNTDSKNTVKAHTPLNLKYKLESVTPRVRTAFTPITNTCNRPSIKNIFIKPETHQTKPIKIFKKQAFNMNHIFSIRTKQMDLNSPTSELNDITNKNIENYEMGKILGQGAYATVRLCLSVADKTKFAIKSYDKYKLKEPHRRKNIRKEIQIMKMLDHPNIVKMYEAIKSPKHVHIVQEYFPGFSLGNYLRSRVSKRLPELEARIVFKQLLLSVDYLHSIHVSHRDIKLDNILIDSKLKIKLIDFGFSCVEESKSRVFCGTPSYMSAEIVNRKEYLTQPADIWALGVVLYVILTGVFPFRAGNDKDLFAKIAEGIRDVPDCVPILARRLIFKMLHQNPMKRPNSKEIINDPWVVESQESVVYTTKMCRSPSTER